MITLDPSLTAAAQRQLESINAARPKDADGEFIGPPTFASVDDMLAANLNAVAASWKAAQDDADALALKPLAAVFTAASPDKQQAAISILQS